MTNTDLETIRRSISEICAAYDEPDSPEALACAFYQLRRVRDYVLPRCAPSGRKGGQIGGRSRSAAKIGAAKANGKKGGRPKKEGEALAQSRSVENQL